MTTKRLNFPSMDGGDEDSIGLYRQNDSGEYEPYQPPSWADDEWDEDLYGEEGEDDGATGGDQSSDSTLDGETAAYERAMELTAGEDDFEYFPSDSGEENNQQFSMKRLQEIWGPETKRNIGIANFFFKNFLHPGLQKEAEHTGVASHFILIEGLHRAAKHAEKLAVQQLKGEPGTRKMRFKGMDDVIKQKLEERCRDMASRVYSEAQAKIIEIHGGIKHG